MAEAFLCDYIRTPIGRYGGALAPVRTDDLGALPLAALLARNPGLDPAAVEEVWMGCANQAGEDNRNVARMPLLLAGLPETVPGVTVTRLCGSGLEAVAAAARATRSGDMQLAVAGGVESLTRAPFAIPKGATPRRRTLWRVRSGHRRVSVPVPPIPRFAPRSFRVGGRARSRPRSGSPGGWSTAIPSPRNTASAWAAKAVGQGAALLIERA